MKDRASTTTPWLDMKDGAATVTTWVAGYDVNGRSLLLASVSPCCSPASNPGDGPNRSAVWRILRIAGLKQTQTTFTFNHTIATVVAKHI